MPGAMALAVVALLGCKNLPNPEADDLARTLRRLDAAQRPNGEDLPVERFLAWTAERDSGHFARDELDTRLLALIEEQRALVGRLAQVPTPTPEGKEVVLAYRTAHSVAHQGMEEVLAGRRLSDLPRAAAGEQTAKQGLGAIRLARSIRAARSDMIGLTADLEAVAPETPTSAGAAIRRQPESVASDSE